MKQFRLSVGFDGTIWPFWSCRVLLLMALLAKSRMKRAAAATSWSVTLHSFVSGEKERKKESRPPYSSDLRWGSSFQHSGMAVIPVLWADPVPSVRDISTPGESLSARRPRPGVGGGGGVAAARRQVDTSAPHLCAALSPLPRRSWLCSGFAEGDARRRRPAGAAACAPTSRPLSHDSEVNSPPDGWAHACGGSQRSTALALMLAPSASLSKL